MTHPADDETGRPAAVAFPVCAGSLEGVREMARGDAGALAVCDAALPDVATPVDQRAAARASGGGSNDIAGADRGVQPPSPAMDPNALRCGRRPSLRRRLNADLRRCVQPREIQLARVICSPEVGLVHR